MIGNEFEIAKLKQDKQKLVDIMFEIGLTIASNKNLQKSSNEQVADWIKNQLNQCGFPTTAVGSSWGVLD